MTGRARITIGGELVAIFLKSGMRAVVPVMPIRDVTVVDVRLGRYGTIQLLIESPDLSGPDDATIENAPDVNVVMSREPVIEKPFGIGIALELARIVDRPCQCEAHPEDAPDAWRFVCPACMAKKAMRAVPTAWQETVTAVRRELGELGPEPDPGDVTDEVPGA